MSTNNAPARNKQPLLVLLGPTAVGKTRYSLEIAKACNAEIISGDSMQVYRGMNIGTAKIQPEEQEGIPHHLIDICEPGEAFSAAAFQERCTSLIPEIAARGKLPFIVGGTGLYIESLCYGYEFSEQASDERLREELAAYALQHGNEALHAKLQAVDPEAAERLHPNDTRRVIRAIEVYELTGQSMSGQLSKQRRESPYSLCLVGLSMPRDMLYRRIEQRVDQMIEEGLVEEVRQLMQSGVPRSAVAMQSLGYKEIIPYLAGECSLADAVTLLKRDTRRFAKRQLSWFRHMPDINWVDISEEENFFRNLAAIHAIIAGKLAISFEYIVNQSFSNGGSGQ